MMKLLLSLAVVEAIIIFGLVVTRSRIYVAVEQSFEYSGRHPLKLALSYESPDSKFEELTMQYPEWVSHRSNYEGAANWPILADCALDMRTNYIRILISHGADVDQALRCLEELDLYDAVNLIRRVQSETTVRSGLQ